MSEPFGYFSLTTTMSTTPARNDSTLRVMSYNLRYGLANDGVNSWENRRELLIDSIREFDPDVIGTQECLWMQADFLCEQLSDYRLIGVGRLDGRRDGELNALLYRTARLEPLDSGTFWLSETPDRPGSRGWDADLPRIVTWAKFYDTASEQALVSVNTHWDHLGHQAKLESARLMRRWIVERTQGLPTIVTGDFNIDVDSVPFHLLADGEPKLIDAYRKAHPGSPNELAADGTFHGFSGKQMPDRIDWILVTPALRIERCEVDRFNRDGRYPSDHFPVAAVLRIG